jgi:excinuclease ABC subunit C
MTPASHLDFLREQARGLPEDPGVYFWKDARERTLYIGKAVNLRARVTSYFSAARHHSRTREMLGRARSIRFEVTETELQALFRESVLIKQEQPKYNRALKTPARAWYLKFDQAVEHPFMETARSVDQDGSRYFGPFRSSAVMRETMTYLHDVLPLRKCTARKPRCRPCMYYQMHSCAAPFLDTQHEQDHEDAIGQLFELLDGREDRVIGWLEAKRDRLSESLLFERAAEMQARLDSLQHLLQRQTVLEAAIKCRCLLIHQDERLGDRARLLLVAQGNVISARDASNETTESVYVWVRAHAPVLRVERESQEEIDAADVLRRWLNVRRERIRWVTVRHDTTESDLYDRIRYVLGSV